MKALASLLFCLGAFFLVLLAFHWALIVPHSKALSWVILYALLIALGSLKS